MIGSDRPLEARMLAYVCPRSWSRTLLMPAFEQTDAQKRLISCRGFPSFPGNRNGLAGSPYFARRASS
jgi:hypothetical protein